MTADAAPHRVGGRARAAAERRRRRLAVLLGVLSVPAAVVAAGFLTWSASDGAVVAPAITATTLAPTPSSSPALVPDGDYAALCEEVRRTGDPGTPPRFDAVYRLVLDADLTAWARAAPPEFQATLGRLEANRTEAAAVVGAAPDIATLDQATEDRLPEWFASDLRAVSLMLATECAPG